MAAVLHALSDEELTALEAHWSARQAEHRAWDDHVGTWWCTRQLDAVTGERRARGRPVATGWPAALPLVDERHIEEGLVVWSRSGDIEGRTTGSRLPCRSASCDGWQIGVRWETGQQLFVCSQGWAYDPTDRSIRITDGGEVSARFVSPKPLGVDPLPREAWPARDALARTKGWRTTP
jgi:hypothetical protein